MVLALQIIIFFYMLLSKINKKPKLHIGHLPGSEICTEICLKYSTGITNKYMEYYKNIDIEETSDLISWT